MKKFLCMLLLSLTGMANAQGVVSITGAGSVILKGPLNQSIKDSALLKAQMNAIERFMTEKGGGTSEAFLDVEDKIKEKIDDIIRDTVILGEQTSPTSYKVSVRIEVSQARIDNIFKKTSATGQADASEKSRIAFFFMAKEADNVKSFDSRVAKIESSGAQREYADGAKVNTSEGEKITRGQVSTNASKSSSGFSDESVTRKTETGGSVTRKADQTGFQVLSMSSYKSSITTAFTSGGFMPSDLTDLVAPKELEPMRKGFASGEDYSFYPLAAKLKASGIRYLVVATINVGLPAADRNTGQPRVNAEISGIVLDVANGMSQVASVPVVQQASLGPDAASAKTTAIKNSADRASRELVASMRKYQ